jgi:protein SCO1/2
MKNVISINILRYVFPGIVLLLAGIWLGTGLESGPETKEINTPSATVYEIPVILPRFTLIDHNGEEFNQWSLSRKWTFMFFGYTFCPDVCPVALVDLDDIYNNLVEKGDLAEKTFNINTEFVFVTVDPARDTVEEMKDYVPYFNEAFIGLTGRQEEIDLLTRPMGVAYMRVPGEDSEGDYLVDHSASLLLIDPLGRLRASFLPPHDPKQIAEDFRNIRTKYTAECCITADEELETVIFDYSNEKEMKKK